MSELAGPNNPSFTGLVSLSHEFFVSTTFALIPFEVVTPTILEDLGGHVDIDTGLQAIVSIFGSNEEDGLARRIGQLTQDVISSIIQGGEIPPSSGEILNLAAALAIVIAHVTPVPSR